MGDDGLLHLDVTYGTDTSWTKRSLRGNDRIFVLKQYAHARPVILLAPCISVYLSAREKPLHITLCGSCCEALSCPLESSKVPLLLGVPIVIISILNGTSI